MGRHLLPKSGSRSRRVLDALFGFPVGPVDEIALMARHGTDNHGSATWRRNVYRQLQDAFLIVREDGPRGAVFWSLTDKGRRLMQAEQLALAMPCPVDPQLVPPRTAPVFRPMVQGSMRMRTTREGALDYLTIPSVMGGKRCV